MKKLKKKSNNLVTREYVDKKFKESRDYVDKKFNDSKEYTDKKFNELREYVDIKFNDSKDYVDKRFERLFKYLDHRFEPLEAMAKEFWQFKERIYLLIDKILGQYEKFDQENVAAWQQYQRTSQRLEEHEKRITALEKKVLEKTSS